MKILFLSHYFYPHVGGVEKHVYKLSLELIKKGHKVTILTERFDKELSHKDKLDEIKINRFNYPKIKFIGIFFIWYFIWKNRQLIFESDIVHIHDVFIWYLPFRLLFLTKKVFITIHGLEWGNPTSISGVIQKRLAVKLSTKSIGVGKFIEKYTGVKFDEIIYGATDLHTGFKKKKNTIVFVGRLSKDTGILEFLKYIKNKKFNVDFIGDGELSDECRKYGTVYGFTEPDKFLKFAEYAVPGGYLACLEAMSYKCKVKVFFNNKLKADYWKLSPMYKYIKSEDINNSFKWVKKQSWEILTDNYINLWES